MKLVFRVLALLFVAPSTYYFIYWVPFSFIPVGEERWIASIVSSVCALGAGWYVWSRSASAPDRLISCILYGAILVGGVGFAAGFFGPIIFAPGANQGPLLGIFITGPLGFLLGAVGGLVYWWIRLRKMGMETPSA
jgi:hypothetical protein